MTKKKTTKRALLMSALSLMMCVTMFVSSTFAWFTDTVTSAGNKIQAGTLKIDLELLEKKDDGTTEWTSIKDNPKAIFDYDKWEPGYTDIKVFKIKNEGTLALKWVAKFVSQSDLTELADVIDVYVNTEATTYPEKRDDLTGWTKVGNVAEFVNTISETTKGILERGASANLGIALKMQESAGNEYQELDLGGVFDIQIFATQYTYESDSFDNQYDKEAYWPDTVNTDWYNDTDKEFVLYTAGDLAGFAQLVNSGTDTFSGKTVKLGADIDLNDIAWTPIGSSADGWNSKFNGTFIGTGYTISSLYVTGTKGLGLFGYVGNSAHIEGVTIDGAYVAGNDYVGAVMGTGYLAANCLKNNTVKNATIIAMPYLMEEGVTYDGGAKAGAVAGYAINGNISGNKAIDCKVMAYRDLGGIVGMAAGENRNITASDNSVENLTLTYVRALPYADGKVNENMNSFVGRYDENKVTVVNNTEVNEVTIEVVDEYINDDITYVMDDDKGTVTLYVVSEDYASDTVNVPEGVTNIGGYAFAYNSNIETIVLPSTVTTLNDRAFRDTSASMVVLNEGLTNISYQAFRNASNVTTVEIPSTVTTISKEAFQNSGVKTLTIPATVTTIEYGGLRDMKELETVTIESSADIPVYAFRACTNLKTVFLTNEDITFGGGSRGMIFTNKENGDGSAITVYVASEVVKERLLAADTASKDYGGYTIVVGHVVSGDSAPEAAAGLSGALSEGESAVLTEDLTFSAGDTTANSGYGATGVAVKEGAILDGNGNTLTVNDANGTWDCAVNAQAGTIKNLTVNGAFRGIFMGGATGDVYIENVVIDKVCYTFNSDGGNKEYGVYISNSTLNGWTSYSDVHKEVVFTNCNFGADTGGYKYAFCRPYNASVFENCVFEEGYEFDTTKTSDIVFSNCYYGDTLITAENAATLGNGETTLFYNGLNGITIK